MRTISKEKRRNLNLYQPTLYCFARTPLHFAFVPLKCEGKRNKRNIQICNQSIIGWVILCSFFLFSLENHHKTIAFIFQLLYAHTHITCFFLFVTKRAFFQCLQLIILKLERQQKLHTHSSMEHQPQIRFVSLCMMHFFFSVFFLLLCYSFCFPWFRSGSHFSLWFRRLCEEWMHAWYGWK